MYEKISPTLLLNEPLSLQHFEESQEGEQEEGWLLQPELRGSPGALGRRRGRGERELGHDLAAPGRRRSGGGKGHTFLPSFHVFILVFFV